MGYPPVIVVDENDHEIGTAPLAEVWQKGLYHRIVSIFVQDDQGCILLQLRSPEVKIYPGCWDQAAGGHVDEGQTYEQAAMNEIAEELGLHDVTLTVLGTFRSNNKLDDGRIINQFERVYIARIRHNVVLRPEANEVSKLQWFTPAELKIEIAKHPETFTPGLLYGLREYFPALLA
jgi:isopentenyl-diphosphate delta-isomerase type 1